MITKMTLSEYYYFFLLGGNLAASRDTFADALDRILETRKRSMGVIFCGTSWNIAIIARAKIEFLPSTWKIIIKFTEIHVSMSKWRLRTATTTVAKTYPTLSQSPQTASYLSYRSRMRRIDDPWCVQTKLGAASWIGTSPVLLMPRGFPHLLV